MALKVFYSWQSDLPNRTNRGFIQRTLEKAIAKLNLEAAITPADREEIVLDMDTGGVPGHPPITDTIMAKIAECDVFVADLSFVGKTEAGRLIPNPNVLIEYGAALVSPGHARFILVMNAAFGGPEADNLPFDMRHARWPKTYTVSMDDTEEARRFERKKLQAVLEKDIASILQHSKASTAADPKEPATGVLLLAPESVAYPLPSKSKRSSFLDDGDLLCILRGRFGDLRSEVRWLNGPQAYLRLIPEKPLEDLTPVDVLDIMNKHQVPLLGREHGQWLEANEWGAVKFDAIDNNQSSAHQIVQLTTHGEIWSVDQTLSWENRERKGQRIVGWFEPVFISRLASYLKLATEQLHLDTSFTVEIGFTGIKNAQLALPPPPPGYIRYEQIGGNAVRDDILGNVNGVAAGDDPKETLMSAFRKIWGNFGLRREEIYREA